MRGFRTEGQALRAAVRVLEAELAEARSHRDAVIHGLSGQIRVPIDVMVAATRALEQSASSEETRRFAAQAGRSAARLARMIDDVFAASETSPPRASHKSLLEVPVALNEAATASPAPERIHVEAPAALVGVADPGGVAGILHHLLDNAIRFSTGRITMRGEESGRTIQITVTDSGPGVAPCARERIFDRFFTAPVAGVDGGAGTGLSLARRAARSLGGELRLDATYAAGARFVLTIPGLSSQHHALSPRARWMDPAAAVPPAAAGLPLSAAI